ncbi:MAG: ATP synthase F1 subunit gamma [Firmicutes bacterium]|nr:ATP synthase F1 subunit gamma [Bacillota bacterium]
MNTLRDLKRRIKAVKNIGHITSAMKTLASAKIRKTEDRQNKVLLYESRLQEVMDELVQGADPGSLELLTNREPHRYGVVVMVSDMGFCGSFNHNILNAAHSFIKSGTPGEDRRVIAVGKKAISSFIRRGIPCELTVPRWNPDFATAQKIADKCVELFLQAKVDRIYVFYSKPITAGKLQAFRETFLPVSFEERVKHSGGDFLIEPDPLKALEAILPHFLSVKMHKLLLETRTGELKARIQAMTNATENAESLVNELTLQFFRARQESITREIIEITSGSEAMK